jgi:hypothetical protein
VCRPDITPHLIELPVMGSRPVTAQASGRLKAQDAVQLLVCRTGVMLIRSLRRLNGKAPIVDRQIARQELIRRIQRGDIREPHLLDHPILNGVKEPLHPSLGLGGVGRDQLDSQLAQHPPKLTRRIHSRELFVQGGRDRRLIGRMFVRVDGHRSHMPSHAVREAVHRRDRSFIRVEPGKRSITRIVDMHVSRNLGPRPLNQSWCKPFS